MATYPELAGRTALLAGGATLIGAELARAFAAQGCNVAIADIDEAGGTAAAHSCGERGLFVATDVTSDASIDAGLASVRDRFGGIDFLVNIATSYLDDGLATSRETWLRSLDIGLVGGAMLAQKLRDDLAARNGAIVNFSSISAHRAQAGRFVYPAIKGAIAQLTRSQALEFAPAWGAGERRGPGVDLVQRDQRPERRRPRQGGPGWRGLPHDRANRRCGRSRPMRSCSCVPPGPLLSPGPNCRSMAAIWRWDQSRPARRSWP